MIDFAPILKNISRHITLSDEESNHFCSLFKHKKVLRKEILLHQDRSCKYFYFVNSGALRTFHSDKNGKESTIMFAVADWWVTDMPCFITGKPAMVSIQAIENSDLLELSKDNFDKLFGDIPKFEKFFRIMMQNAYIREQLRIIQNLSLTAEERYDNFLEKYPHISQQVTQKQIASYLGITPEFLSVIRKSKSIS